MRLLLIALYKYPYLLTYLPNYTFPLFHGIHPFLCSPVVLVSAAVNLFTQYLPDSWGSSPVSQNFRIPSYIFNSGDVYFFQTILCFWRPIHYSA